MAVHIKDWSCLTESSESLYFNPGVCAYFKLNFISFEKNKKLFATVFQVQRKRTMEAEDLIFWVIVLKELQGPFFFLSTLCLETQVNWPHFLSFTEFSFQRALATECYAFIFVQL